MCRCQQQSAMLGATARAAICLMRLDRLRRLFGRMTGLALPREHLLSSGHRQAGEESAEVHVGEALCQTNQGSPPFDSSTRLAFYRVPRVVALSSPPFTSTFTRIQGWMQHSKRCSPLDRFVTWVWLP